MTHVNGGVCSNVDGPVPTMVPTVANLQYSPQFTNKQLKFATTQHIAMLLFLLLSKLDE